MPGIVPQPSRLKRFHGFGTGSVTEEGLFITAISHGLSMMESVTDHRRCEMARRLMTVSLMVNCACGRLLCRTHGTGGHTELRSGEWTDCPTPGQRPDESPDGPPMEHLLQSVEIGTPTTVDEGVTRPHMPMPFSYSGMSGVGRIQRRSRLAQREPVIGTASADVR